MRKLLFILVLVVASCGTKNKDSAEQKSVRQKILNRDFANNEVRSIDIVEIEHPMLGGVLDTKTLDSNQQKRFLSSLDQLNKKGIYKCGSTHVIRINFETDTLKLKVCGNLISNRFSDVYFELPNGQSIIEEFLENK